MSVDVCFIRVREHEIPLEAVTHPSAHQLDEVIRYSLCLGIGGSEPPERMRPDALRVNVREMHSDIAFELGQQRVVSEWGPSGLTAA